MPILFAPIGEEVVVKEVKGSDETRNFIQKLGLAPGAHVTVISSHDGDLIVSVKDVRIALTKSMASRIMI